MPVNQLERTQETYRRQLENKSDFEIIEAFAYQVRNGEKLTKQESTIIEPLMAEINLEENK